MKLALTSVVALAGLASVASGQIVMQEIRRLDLRTSFNSTNSAGLGTLLSSVAWNGTDVYAAGFASAASSSTGILRVNSPLTNPTPTTSTFGSLTTAVASGGYRGLDISGNTLLASWDVGGTTTPPLPPQNNSFQAFETTAGNALRWNNGTAGSIGPVGRSFAGPSFNPGLNAAGGLGSGAAFVIQGSGFERMLNTTTGGPNASPAGFNNANINIVATAPATTAWRDLDYNPRTGDVYMRVNNDVSAGTRTSANQYNSGTGLTIIRNLTDQNQVSTNIQFLDTAAFGDLLIFNDRASTAPGQSFFANNLVSNTAGVAQTVTFLNSTGGAFAPFGTGNGGYDYSFDAATQTLAISDFANAQVYIFQIPTPGAAALLGLGGLAAFRRRR